MSAWAKYQNDFDDMSDRDIEEQTRWAQHLIDENEEWVEAVVAWKSAGSPRTQPKDTPNAG